MVAFWSPQPLVKESQDLQLVALILGGAGLGGALLSAAGLTFGLRRLRRIQHRPALGVNAPPE